MRIRTRPIAFACAAFLLSVPAVAQVCHIVSNGLKVCTGEMGVGTYTMTSNLAGDILRYELQLPNAAPGVDMLTAMASFAVLMPNINADQRGAFILKVLKTANTRGTIKGFGFTWSTRQTGSAIAVTAEKGG